MEGFGHRRSQVEKVLNEIKHFSRGSTEAAKKLFEAYVSDIKGGYCPRLDELYRRETCFDLIDEEKYALVQVYGYFREGESGYMGSFVDNAKDKIKKICESFGYEAEQSHMSAQGMETEENIPRNGMAEESNCANAEIDNKNEKTDSIEIALLKAKNEELEEKLRQMQQECDRIRFDCQIKQDQAAELEKTYNKLVADFEFEKDISRKEWTTKYEDEYYQKKQELDIELANVKLTHENNLMAKAEEESKRIISEKLGEYIGAVRDDWCKTHREFSASGENTALIVSRAKNEACSESSKLQREMKEEIDKYKEFMDEYMVKFCANMDQWRSSVFSIQLKGFAEWYTRFSGFVDRFDSRVVKGEDGKEFETIVKIGSSLTSLKNALERELPSMGLKSYYPLAGEIYDSIYHESEETFVENGTLITECLKPGVEQISANDELRRVLVKAQVNIEVN